MCSAARCSVALTASPRAMDRCAPTDITIHRQTPQFGETIDVQPLARVVQCDPAGRQEHAAVGRVPKQRVRVRRPSLEQSSDSLRGSGVSGSWHSLSGPQCQGHAAVCARSLHA